MRNNANFGLFLIALSLARVASSITQKVAVGVAHHRDKPSAERQDKTTTCNQ